MLGLTRPQFTLLLSLRAGSRTCKGRQQIDLTEQLRVVRTYVKEDPTATYDLHAAFSKDPDTVKVEDAFDDYTKIQQAAIRAGKRPPKKKKPKYDAVGQQIGVRFINKDVPLRIRERLIAEGIKMEPQFFVGRYGLNKELVKRIRSAFRFFEIVRIELGHPWTDNTTKFAERLELRTGAIVLDRAGSRFLLYRGFTHADLARKGLLDPGCFAVGGEYDIGSATRQPRFYIEKMKARKRLLDAHKANSSQERTAAPIRKGNARQKPGKKAVRPWQSINKTQKKKQPLEAESAESEMRQNAHSQSDDDDGWVFDEEPEEITFAMPRKKSEVIDVDDVEEKIIKDNSSEKEEERVRNLVADMQYNAALLDGAVPKK